MSSLPEIDKNMHSLEPRRNHDSDSDSQQTQHIPETQDMEILGARHGIESRPDRRMDDRYRRDPDEGSRPEQKRIDPEVRRDNIGDPVGRKWCDPAPAHQRSSFEACLCKGLTSRRSRTKTRHPILLVLPFRRHP